MVLAVYFGLAISIAHYFSDKFRAKCKPWESQLVSLSAGIAITYLFLHLFPDFSQKAVLINKFLFVWVLLGFVLFHLVEKYIYQHAFVSKHDLLAELALEDSIASSIYHFIVGITLTALIDQSVSDGVLFFIPMFVYTAISTLPVDPTNSRFVRFLMASSTLLGVLFARFLYTDIPSSVLYSLIGLIIGVLFYTVTRHSIPAGKEGKPWFFALGALLYVVLLYLIGF